MAGTLKVFYPVLRLMIRRTANNHGVEQLTLQFTLKSTYIPDLLLIMETDCSGWSSGLYCTAVADLDDS